MDETTGRQLVARERGGALASRTPLIDAFELPDVYAEDGIAVEAIRTEAIATISAGYREPSRGGRPGLPQRSTDGTIYLTDPRGRAPGLARALVRSGGKVLTLAFPSDDPYDFIKWMYTRYSATELQVFGDKTGLMELQPGGRGYRLVEAGTDEFKRLLKTCKASVNVYFALAEWGEDGPAVVFDDGVGAYYRLRFTSRNSLRSILAGLKAIGDQTQGRIAGIPFDLALDYRETGDNTGKRRTIPVWTILVKPPGGRRLTSLNFEPLMELALAQGRALMLSAPRLPDMTLDDAAREVRDDDLDETVIEGDFRAMSNPSEAELDLIERGGRCDAAHWNRQWHAAVAKSYLADDENRAVWIRAYTHGRTGHLPEALYWMTEKQAQAFVLAASVAVKAVRQDAPPPPRPSAPATGTAGRSYRDLFPEDQEQEGVVTRQAGPGEAQMAPVGRNGGEAEHGAPEPSVAVSVGVLILPGVPDFAGWSVNDVGRPAVLEAYGEWSSVVHRLDPAYEIPDATRLNLKALVEALKGLVGYAQSILDVPEDDDEETETVDEEIAAERDDGSAEDEADGDDEIAPQLAF